MEPPQRIRATTRNDWQDELANNQAYIDFRFGLVSVMARTGTGKSIIPLKSIELDRRHNVKGMHILVPCIDHNLVEEHTNKYVRFLQEMYPSAEGLRERLYAVGEELQALVLAEQIPAVLHLVQEQNDLRYQLRQQVIIGEAIMRSDKHNSIDLKFGEYGEERFTIHIKSLPGYGTSLEPFIQEIPDNHSIYIDEFHKVQTQFGLVHGKSRKCHTTKGLKGFAKGYDRHGYKLLTSMCRNRKVVIFSATLDDVICNELPPYRGQFHILSLVVYHPPDTVSNPVIHSSNCQDMQDRAIYSYQRGIRSVLFCANGAKVKKLKEKLISQGVPGSEIYSYTSSDPGNFDVHEVRNSLVNIFINKGTTGMDVFDIGFVAIFRELEDSSSCRDKEMMSISNFAVQVIGRIRNGGEVWWQRDDIADTSLYEITRNNYELPFEISENETQLMAHLNENSDLTHFEGHVLRPFIWEFIDKFKEKKKSTSEKKTVLCEFYRKFRQRVMDLKVKMRQPDISTYQEEYLALEKNMMKVYREVFEQVVDTSENVINGMFSVDVHEDLGHD